MDQYVASLEAAAEAGLAGGDEEIAAIIYSSRAFASEWQEIEPSIPPLRKDLKQRIAERVALIEFFTCFALVRVVKDDDGTLRFSLQHVERYDIDDGVATRAYAAIPVRYLEYLESSMVTVEGEERITLPRAPVDLEILGSDTTPRFWTDLGKKTLGELREGIDELCAVVRN
ncbi:MAG: hypothetical protein GY719_29175 [bacterium]|nr:hypothetical protein [bacterium]